MLDVCMRVIIININQGDHFIPCSLKNREIDARPLHSCCNKVTTLTCIDESGNYILHELYALLMKSFYIIIIGIEHQVSFIHCDCESLALSLIRAQLWPATPQHPRLAFTFSSLDWAEALLLECHVALKHFCSALYFYSPYVIAKAGHIIS